MHCDGTYLDAYYKLPKLDVSESKLADGEAVLLEGVRRSPSDWFFRYQLGTVHFAMGQHGEAPRDFVAAQSFHPDMPAEFHAKLANTYLKNRRIRQGTGRDRSLSEFESGRAVRRERQENIGDIARRHCDRG